MSRIQDILQQGGTRRQHAPFVMVAIPACLHHQKQPAAEAARRIAWNAATCARRATFPRPSARWSLPASTRCWWPVVAPHAPAAEQYRTLRTRLVLLEEGRARRVLLVHESG